MTTYENGAQGAIRALGLEKTAVLGHLLGTTLGLHTGANTLFKGLRSLHVPQGDGAVATGVRNLMGALPVGHNYETQSLAMGIRNGIAGNQLNPGLKNVMTTGLGPESAIMSDMGQALGKGLAGKSRHEIRRALKQIRKGVAMSPSVRETPLGAPVIGAVNEFLQGPTQLERAFNSAGLGATPVAQGTTLAQAAVPLAAGAGAAALMPHSLIHFGINGLRQAAAKSKYGLRMMRDGFRDGLAGKPQSGAVRAAWDFLVSPAVLDTRRTGEGVRQALQNNEPGVRRLGGFIGSLGGNPENRTSVQQHLAAIQNNPALAAQAQQALAANPGLLSQLGGLASAAAPGLAASGLAAGSSVSDLANLLTGPHTGT